MYQPYRLILGGPMSGKTCLAIELALKQSKPVYTDIVDNTSDKSFLPDSFKSIPNGDWTLIQEPAFIIYNSCEYIPEFCTANYQGDKHRLTELFKLKHFGHEIVFIQQHLNLVCPEIKALAEIIKLEPNFNGRRSFKGLTQ